MHHNSFGDGDSVHAECTPSLLVQNGRNTTANFPHLSERCQDSLQKLFAFAIPMFHAHHTFVELPFPKNANFYIIVGSGIKKGCTGQGEGGDAYIFAYRKLEKTY